uniref:Rab3 GTPase-activating protein catalytic subunit n=1 Tax=Eptatretus burgeri TaxID=7764 RepID=A0A8C4QM23_EPTBU
MINHHSLKQDVPEKMDDHAPDEDREHALPEAMLDLMSMDNDFTPRAHCLVRWFGLRSFVVIVPAAPAEAVITESKCNLLLSSISIALGNTGCQVPVFVQVQQKWRRMYVGQCEGPGVRTDFEMVHLRKAPAHYGHLSGLLDVFKSKIACPLSSVPPVNVCVRFTYVLQDCQQYQWPQPPPDMDACVASEVGGLEIGKLPFGACEDPVSDLHLAATWPHLTEDIIVDNDVYSDLDPLQAPQWSVRVRMADNPQCLLCDFLHEFHGLCHRKESTDQLLGKSLFEQDSGEVGDIGQVLQRLTEPVPLHLPLLPTVSSMVHEARQRIPRKHRSDGVPVTPVMLASIFKFMFSDANGMMETNPGVNEAATSCPDQETGNMHRNLKSAPVDSLTHRLALCLCMINYCHGGLKGVAQVWQEFVQRLRGYWESNIVIPWLNPGPPEFSCCLLHQKFQMLNCCIERRRNREELQNQHQLVKETGGRQRRDRHSAGPSEDASGFRSWESWSEDSEDEFYECESELSGDEGGEQSLKVVNSDGDDPSNEKSKRAEGRFQQHSSLILLSSGAPLYIPITQESAPMTEDLLDEQTEVLAKLGTSAEGAHLRARMQSACLLSDMEAFKAANPGCLLDDFVRWYSPRDYTEAVDGNGHGELSARMRIPGNMWAEAWESCKPIPARRQKRLFDDTREAERVLHFLAGLKPAEVAQHLLPCLIHAALLKVEEESSDDVPTVKRLLQQTISLASRVLRQPNSDPGRLADVLQQLGLAETVIARGRSLRAKFAVQSLDKDKEKEEVERFVTSLLEQPEVPVIGAGRGPAGSILRGLFINSQQNSAYTPGDDVALIQGNSASLPSGFPAPRGREFVLRTLVPRPAPYSCSVPQRMFCVLLKDQFTLAGAFSSDTSFY